MDYANLRAAIRTYCRIRFAAFFVAAALLHLPLQDAAGPGAIRVELDLDPQS